MNLKFIGLIFPVIGLADKEKSWQSSFHDLVKWIMEGGIDVHHDIFYFSTVICIYLVWALGRILYLLFHTKNPIPEKIKPKN